MTEEPTENKAVDAGQNPDPFEGKSIDELKAMITESQKTSEENIKRLNSYVVMVQTIIIKLKETGLDLQMIGRNAEQILQQATNTKQR